MAAGDVDKNVRLLQWRRDALPTLTPRMQGLGIAVASSGCFPGGLQPVSIPHLYAAKGPDGRPDPYVVKLTDGGVRDNQGIDALLDNDCTELLVSDGSGQMGDVAIPATRLPALLPRVNSIEGKESREQRVLRVPPSELTFMHLLSGVPAPELEPLGAKPIPPWPPRSSAAATTTTGINADAQRLVAQIRTDLDAFSDLEASALMEVGYRITSDRATVEGAEELSRAWRFSVVASRLERPDSDFLRHLRIARQRFFKPILYLLDPLAGALTAWLPRSVRNAIGVGVAALAVGGLIWVGLSLGSSTLSSATVYAVAISIVLAAILFLFSGMPGLRTASKWLFDIVLVGVAVVFPLWLVGLLELAAASAHRAQGHDGFVGPSERGR
jgi:NTE family protein